MAGRRTQAATRIAAMCEADPRGEVELVRRLLNALSCKDFTLTRRERPDVSAKIGGRYIGVEVTEFHSDETENHKGSARRAAEEKAAREASGALTPIWINVDPLPGLKTRIADKVSRATTYYEKQFAELWLLIVAQLPKSGAVTSTYILPSMVNLDDMDSGFDEMLRTSLFDRVYFLLCLDKKLYAWSRSERWRLLSESSCAPDKSLWFRSLLNDSEWLRDPDGKALTEARKALDDLLEQKHD